VSRKSEAYEIGKKMNVFIKDLRGKEYKGLVWPGDTAFVDYFHPNAT
jgi:alpha-glucosidase